jgi:hypothetical protein
MRRILNSVCAQAKYAYGDGTTIWNTAPYGTLDQGHNPCPARPRESGVPGYPH